MVGANKNQSIHEVLPNLNHLDKHKPYGGLSIVFTGDLKQLGKVNFYRVLFFSIFKFYIASEGCLHFQTFINS